MDVDECKESVSPKAIRELVPAVSIEIQERQASQLIQGVRNLDKHILQQLRDGFI